MSQIQALRIIGTYLVRREWIGAVATLVFALYLGGVISFTIDGLLGEEEIPVSLTGFVDWMYLTMFPCFGLLMNKSVFAMWRDDVYTKRIAHWRSMPIPLSAIIKTRILQSVIMLPVIGGAFILLQYTLAPELRDSVTLGQWFTAGLLWLCFAFIVNAVYIYMELGNNGKRYTLIYLGLMVVTAILVCLLTWQSVHLFSEVLRISKSDQAPVWIIFLVLLAIIANWVGYHLTLRRVRARSITF